MSSTNQLVWLISGTSRGIGLALVTKLLQDPKNIVFAGVRSASSPGGLKQLAENKEINERLHIVSLPSDDEEKAKAVAKEVEEKIGYLDIVIANAGETSTLRNISTPVSD